MTIRITVVTSATAEPLTLAEAKRHLRVTSTSTTDADSLYISSLITVARNKVEGLTNRRLLSQTLNLYLDQWPATSYLELPYAPLKSVPTTGITYTNSTGATSTFGSTKWDADIASEPGRIVLTYGDSWPSDSLASLNPITIRHVVGASSSNKVPVAIKQAILLLISHYYEYREPIITGQAGFTVAEVPKSVDHLLADYRLHSF